MNTVTELLHYFGLVCLVASLLLRILPAPEEIGWKPYAIFHGVIRRASLNLPNSSLNVAAGNTALNGEHNADSSK